MRSYEIFQNEILGNWIIWITDEEGQFVEQVTNTLTADPFETEEEARSYVGYLEIAEVHPYADYESYLWVESHPTVDWEYIRDMEHYWQIDTAEDPATGWSLMIEIIIENES